MMTRKHAKCTICYEDSTAGKLIQSEMAALETRIKGLYGGLQDGTTYRFSKSMAYKMVQSLAQFNPSYQAVTEIILDSNKMESTCQVNFANCTTLCSFPGRNDVHSRSAHRQIHHGIKAAAARRTVSPERLVRGWDPGLSGCAALCEAR